MEKSDFHENFDLFFDSIRAGLPEARKDCAEPLPEQPELGHKSIRRWSQRSDMEIVVSEFTLNKDYAFSLQPCVAMVEVNCCLLGKREINLSGSSHQATAGSFALQFGKPGAARFEFAGGEPFRMLSIGIPVKTFNGFMEQAWDTGVLIDFERIMGDRHLRVFQEKIGPAVSFLMKRFASAVDKPGVSNLELECHALEIFTLACRLFLKEEEESSRAVSLSRDEMDKLREARQIMKERLVDPPTLMELSRMIGLNDFKLKAGFKELYGTTVFGYLKDERLRQAMLMLQTGRINVGEAACAVGYLNPSYFAEAFRSKYGVNPGLFMKEVKTESGRYPSSL